jgi:hypothetical protein
MLRRIKVGFDILRNGVVYAAAYSNDASISMDCDAEIKTAVKGTFRPDATVNYLMDQIRPYMIINGVRSNLGKYLATTRQEHNGEIAMEAYDLAVTLKQNAIEERLFFETGQRYRDIFVQILEANGITEYLIDPTEAVLATDREDWEIGMDHLTIINGLLKEINYNSLWFDAAGIARLQRRKPLDTNSIAHYYKANAVSQISADYSRTGDAFSTHNVFIAMIDNPDFGHMSAVAVNDDPTSAVSTIALGRRIVAPVYRPNNTASQSELQAYVNNLMLESKYITETVTFTTMLARHGIFDYAAIDHPDMRGVFSETSWEMSLDESDTMTHTAKKVRNL